MKMKYILNLMLCVVLSGIFSSCSEEENTTQSVIYVTPADLHGTWMLKVWNGQQVDEDLYVYITFDRKERTFVMYDNVNSMYSHKTTGSFSILDDEELGSIINGEYDYEQGFWDEYIVTAFDGNNLSLTLKETSEDVSVYTRCEEIPEDIINGSRSM